MRRHFLTATAATLALMAAAAAPAAFGQQSASYRLTEAVFNSGGHPGPGGAVTSPSYLVRMDAIGGSFSDHRLTGASFQLAGDFISAYPPPSPVTGLGFSASNALQWNQERSAGVYNVYRGTLSTPPLASDMSTCLLSGLTSRSAPDPATPPPMTAFYYLVSAENLLGEEGPSRVDASGVPHSPSNPCPGP